MLSGNVAGHVNGDGAIGAIWRRSPREVKNGLIPRLFTCMVTPGASITAATIEPVKTKRRTDGSAAAARRIEVAAATVGGITLVGSGSRPMVRGGRRRPRL